MANFSILKVVVFGIYKKVFAESGANDCKILIKIIPVFYSVKNSFWIAPISPWNQDSLSEKGCAG